MVNVSRETHKFIIPELKKYNISPDKLNKLNKFVEILTEQNKIHQYISRNDMPKIWNRHIYDSIQLMFHVKHYHLKKLTDIGSGAGFPGLIIAIVYPSLRINLVERKRRRCDFLKLLIKKLELSNVNLYCCNAQEIQEKFKNVVFRAVGNTEKLNNIINKLVKDRGLIFVYQNCYSNLLSLKIDFYNEYILPEEDKIRYIVCYEKLNEMD